jgi:hypothetical protein
MPPVYFLRICGRRQLADLHPMMMTIYWRSIFVRPLIKLCASTPIRDDQHSLSKRARFTSVHPNFAQLRLKKKNIF